MLNWRSWKIWGVPLVGLGAITLFAAGIIFLGWFQHCHGSNQHAEILYLVS